MNPNIQPVHQHFPGHPGEAARVIYNNAPAMGPNDLVNQMGRLNVNPDRFGPGHEARTRELPIGKTIYIGYTFYKADTMTGNKPTWKNISKTEMDFTQEGLSKLVQRGSKKIGVTKYKNLTDLKRGHVDDLLEEFEQRSPQFDWSCVYVRERKFNADGGYETASMDVIIVGKQVKSPNARVRIIDDRVPIQLQSRVPTQIDPRMADNDSRPFVRNGLQNEQWRGPGFQQGQQNPPHPSHQPQPHHAHHPHHPQHMNNVRQPTPPFAPQGHPQGHPQQGHPQQGHPQQGHPQQGHPQQGHPQGPPPPPNHPPGPHMGAQQFANPEQWAPGRPMNGPQPHPQHAAHNHMGPNMEHNPKIGVQVNGMKGVPLGPGTHPGFHQQPQFHPQQAAGNYRRGTPLHGADSEPELVHGISGSSEDESLDIDDLDIEAGHHSDGSAGYERPRYRGSVYRENSASKSKRPQTGYRTHARRQTHKNGRPRASSEFIEMIPADSIRNTKRSGKEHRYKREGGRRGWEQPRVVQGSLDDADILYIDSPRGSRLHHNLQNHVRALHDKESELEEREKMVDYQTRVLNERIVAGRMLGSRMTDTGYLGRPRPWDRHGYGLSGLID